MASRKPTRRQKHRKRDLISLVWPDNTCYTSLVAGVPKGVELNLKAGTWTFGGQTCRIGQGIFSLRETGTPIGVYDRTKLAHLQQMKFDSEWVTRGSGGAIED